MDNFNVGEWVEWVHGSKCHRVGKILEVSADKVKLLGVTTEYWVTKKTLTKNINKPYPVGGSPFAAGMNG